MIEIILAWASIFWFFYVLDKYNKLIKEYNKLVDEYNKLVDEYNKLVDEYNQLEKVNIELKKGIKASLNRQLLDFFIGNCTKDDK